MNDVYIIGGAQTDFVRNWKKEGKNVIALLKEVGLIKKELDGVKVLGSGELTKKLTVKANAFTKSAQEKIETIGGKTEVI